MRWLLLVSLLLPTLASADVPPADGLRYVRFGVRVSNPGALPDHHVVIFPHDTSNGAPMPRYAVVNDSERVYGVGRRSAPGFVAFPKSDVQEGLIDGVDPNSGRTLFAFFESDARVVRSDLRVVPTRTVPDHDPVERIIHVFEIDGIEDGKLMARHTAIERQYPGGRVDSHPPSAAPSEDAVGDTGFWSSPLVWVAGAILANLALALGVLAAFRRKKKNEAPAES